MIVSPLYVQNLIRIKCSIGSGEVVLIDHPQWKTTVTFFSDLGELDEAKMRNSIFVNDNNVR